MIRNRLATVSMGMKRVAGSRLRPGTAHSAVPTRTASIPFAIFWPTPYRQTAARTWRAVLAAGPPSLGGCGPRWATVGLGSD